MTRPGHVTVELPLYEAEGLLRRLDPDSLRDYRSMTAAECDAAEAARKRILQAMKAERPAGAAYVPLDCLQDRDVAAYFERRNEEEARRRPIHIPYAGEVGHEEGVRHG